MSADEKIDAFSRACPKLMRNGPCGGVRDGRCEVPGRGKCVWVVLYETLTREEFLKIQK